MRLFDVLGPVMTGPSSSHTAGAVRIGLTARNLGGEAPKTAEILLHGSFAATGRGHGTDRALVAGLLGMLPKGLVLLISIGLAVGVIRLSKKNVLVRELHSLENLAHCDVVCLDKTGTLTEGSLMVESIHPQTDKGSSKS